jgi:hypothetical protein
VQEIFPSIADFFPYCFPCTFQSSFISLLKTSTFPFFTFSPKAVAEWPRMKFIAFSMPQVPNANSKEYEDNGEAKKTCHRHTTTREKLLGESPTDGQGQQGNPCRPT